MVRGDGVEGPRSVLYLEEVAVDGGGVGPPSIALASSIHSGAVPRKFTLPVQLRSSLDPGETRYTGWFENRLHTSQIRTKAWNKEQ